MGTPRSPKLAGTTRHELNIYHLRYRAARGRRRCASHWLRVPYAGLFALSEVLDRALSQGEILYYKLEATSAITPAIRESMTRWPDALAADTNLGVKWTV